MGLWGFVGHAACTSLGVWRYNLVQLLLTNNALPASLNPRLNSPSIPIGSMSSRYRLRRPGQSLGVSLFARLADFLASLSLAVVLIFTLAATLAFATFVEARYGTPSVQFFVYQTWWFDALLVLLALNIFFAAAVRYPWKRYQTGFVITHIGLLTLIGGAALSRIYGIDSQVIVFEDQTSKWAWGDNHKIRFRELSDSQSINSATAAPSKKEERITFRGGPISWHDYVDKFTFSAFDKSAKTTWQKKVGQSIVQGLSGMLFRLPMRHKAGDVLFSRDDVQVKVADYYSHSSMEGPLQIRVGGAILKRTVVNESDGTSKEIEEPATWSDVPSLYTTAISDKKSYPLGIGEKQFVGGGYFTLTLASNNAQVKAFMESAPREPIGPNGNVVLHAQGKRLEFSVAEKLGKGKFPIEGMDYEIELVEYFPVAVPKLNAKQEVQIEGQPGASSPDSPAVTLSVWKSGSRVGKLYLLSESPELNVYDFENGVFGALWVDQSKRSREERMQLQISSRIEILRSPDQKLFYRYWNLQNVAAVGELPTKGNETEAVNAFKMPFAQLKMYVSRYTPCDGPGKIAVPVEFRRDLPIAQSRPAVQLEILAKQGDGKIVSTKKWLRAASPDDPTVLRQEDRLLVEGGKRKYELTMMLDAIDIGFRVRLDKFERKLDPGTSQASHFSSTVDLIDRDHFHEIRYVDPKSLWPTGIRLDEGCEPGAAIAVDSLRGDIFMSDAKQRVIWQIRGVTGGSEGEKGISELTTQVGGDVLAMSVDAKARKLYWLEAAVPAGKSQGLQRHTSLMSVDLSGKDVVRVHTFSATPSLMAFHESSQQAFFVDQQSGQLTSLNLKTMKIAVLGGDLEGVTGLAAGGREEDPAIYVINSRAGEVARFENDGLKTVVRLDDDQTPISLATAPNADALLVGVSIRTSKAANSNKPPPQRDPDAVLRVDLKSKNITKVAQSRVYAPSAISVDAQTGRIYWIQAASMGENMWITMNAPIDVDDPHSGRSYRLFQESYNGPWLPGSPEFDEIVPASADKDELYMSVLSVNYDPGRGVRSAGCVLVIIGVAVMFFMRAYFFTPRARPNSSISIRSSLGPIPATAGMVEAR